MRANTADDWRVNNFDLIRLFAALEVAVVHTITFLKLSGPFVGVLNSGLRLFPGVPIFFVISGFLVSRSYERSTSLLEFYRNRCLRIYPGLWVSLLAGIVVIAVCGISSLPQVSTGRWLAWWLPQMTGLWFDRPAFLRRIGTGILNGSLWTIPIEVEFYLLLPLLYLLMRSRADRGRRDLILPAILAISIAVHTCLENPRLFPSLLRYNRVLDTLVPYLWMFMVGVLAQRYWPILRSAFAGRLPYWLFAYLCIAAIARWVGMPGRSTDMNPLLFLPLAGVVLSGAFSARELAERWLHHRDLSYGTYVYHMLVVNVAVYFGLRGSALSGLLVIAASLALAALSWRFIEKPFLSRKRYALRSVGESASGATERSVDQPTLPAS